MFAKLLLTILLAGLAVSYAQPTEPIVLENLGFDTPESVLHDTNTDIYLVSNIGGDPFEVDGNGFISQVKPNGDVLDLKWIDGAAEGVTLNSPKGMAIVGGTLYVADMDIVRLFDAVSGAPLGEVAVPGATFLNDVVAAPQGGVFITDSGFNPGFEGSGTDAIYHITPEGDPETVLASTELTNPNGITVLSNGNLLVVPFGAAAVYTVSPEGELLSSKTFPAGSLDGVIVLEDGTTLVSSWETSSVYRGSKGNYQAIIGNVPSPADIGFDARRGRVLIPVFNENRVVIQPLNE